MYRNNNNNNLKKELTKINLLTMSYHLRQRKLRVTERMKGLNLPGY